MLCSDGLTDLYAEDGAGESETPKSIQEVADMFPRVLARARAVAASRSGDSQDKEKEEKDGDKSEDKKPNLALALLREGLGGSDLDKVSSMITLELDSKWVDDVTVLVQRL